MRREFQIPNSSFQISPLPNLRQHLEDDAGNRVRLASMYQVAAVWHHAPGAARGTPRQLLLHITRHSGSKASTSDS